MLTHPVTFFGGGGGGPSAIQIIDQGGQAAPGPPGANTLVNLNLTAQAGDRLVVWLAHPNSNVIASNISGGGGISAFFTGAGLGSGSNKLEEYSGVATGGETSFTVNWAETFARKYITWVLVRNSNGFAPSNPNPKGEFSTVQSHQTNQFIETAGHIHLIALYHNYGAAGDMDPVGVPAGWNQEFYVDGSLIAQDGEGLILLSKVVLSSSPPVVLVQNYTGLAGINRNYISGGSSVVP